MSGRVAIFDSTISGDIEIREDWYGDAERRAER